MSLRNRVENIDYAGEKIFTLEYIYKLEDFDIVAPKSK